MYKLPVIRIQRAYVKNFRNISSGEIRFPCNYTEDIHTPKADVLGLYGQNGSGKTTFIDVLDVLRLLLSGDKIRDEISDLISYGSERAELHFEFSIMKLSQKDVSYARRFIYSVILSNDTIDETIRCATLRNNESNPSRLKTLFECKHRTEDIVFSPRTKLEALFGARQSSKLDELRVVKLLCRKERRSFLFSPEFLNMLRETKMFNGNEVQPLFEILRFAKTSLYVVQNRNSGFISLDADIHINFRTDTAGGIFPMPIDQPTTIPSQYLDIIRRVISSISIVLCKIIPGVNLILVELGTELDEKGVSNTKIQLAREINSSGDELYRLPLKYESDGIKKIISILHLLIAVYNNPSVTVAIDEIDSGIYEYLLGELLRVIQNSGRGQLIFTSHNLHPLETLDSSSIIFTTTNPNARFKRIGNVRASNNLRSMYLREITLSGDSDTSLYMRTNISEVAHAMRAAANDLAEAVSDG